MTGDCRPFVYSFGEQPHLIRSQKARHESQCCTLPCARTAYDAHSLTTFDGDVDPVQDLLDAKRLVDIPELYEDFVLLLGLWKVCYSSVPILWSGNCADLSLWSRCGLKCAIR